MTYSALTQRPIQLNDYQQKELQESVSFDFRQVKDEEETEDASDLTPAESASPVEATNQEPKNATFWSSPEYLQQKLFEEEEKPLDITPATRENNSLVMAHHSTNPLLKSLYAQGLQICQPDNAINAFGEPPFTNWAQGYKETLDYIFLVDGSRDVNLLGLLKMPAKEEMGEGEPQEGRFPSDHVCEMAEVQVS